MTRGIIREVFREHYPGYSRTRRLSVREQHAAQQILTCRTEEQGYHVVRCPGGDFETARFNSCKHRSCPTCGSQATTRWIRTQEARALPCPYHLITFTIPDGLQPLWLYNRVLFANLLFKAAWDSLQAFARDPQWLGALPGAIATLQSWGETLNLHVHLHLLITAGGLDAQGRWVKSKAFLMFPPLAVSVEFRKRFRAKLKRALAAGKLRLPPDTTAAFWRMRFNKFGRQKWQLRIEPAQQLGGGLRYVGAYVHRGPIGESRIKRYDRDELTIAYAHPRKHPHPTFTLSGPEFVQRFLVHVPPKGHRVVRSFGLFHHRLRDRLELARRELEAAAPAVPRREARLPAATDPTPPFLRCPRCGRPLAIVAVVYQRSRDPPERQAA